MMAPLQAGGSRFDAPCANSPAADIPNARLQARLLRRRAQGLRGYGKAVEVKEAEGATFCTAGVLATGLWW